VILGVLLASAPARAPHDDAGARPVEVSAGGRDAAPTDGSTLAELSAPQLLGAHIERRAGAVVLSFELDRSVPHWLERDAAGEVQLVLESTRLAQPLGWLDFRDTPIRYLDVRRVGDALHLALGLASGAPVDVQSAMLDLSAGARLMVQIEARPELAEEAPRGVVAKRALDAGGQDAYREALRLERAGDKARALEVLRTLLARHPEHAQARTRLVDGLAAAGRPAEALRVLRAGPGRKNDPERARLEARLLVEQRSDAEAIAVLDRSLGAAGGDPEYEAFLAALLQRSGAHERALALYEASVAEEPGRADWWLGRAISEETLGKGAEALLSLRRALAIGGLDPEPQRWAQARARALAAAAAGAAEAKP
jgi:tetratricopeptide (TPR) repeat protein